MEEIDRLFATSGLSLERMRSFLAVVDAGGQSKAAGGDPTKQSQFSRQIRELEGFFGVALTKRVGKHIAITEAGEQLAKLIRLQLRELSHFRESQAGGSPSLTLGCSASISQWVVAPQLPEIRNALRNASIDVIQSRSLELVRAVTDGRIDLGIVRSDAVGDHVSSVTLGEVSYSFFAAKRLAPGSSKRDVQDLLRRLPMVRNLPGGRFDNELTRWLEEEEIEVNVVARVSSFIMAGEMVTQGHGAAILPDIAEKTLERSAVFRKALPLPYRRRFRLIWNSRSLERAGITEKQISKLAQAVNF